jgi:hypothetical protein
MNVTALLLSRIQFGSTVAFHIIFPSFTIGLAAWLTVLEALHLSTGRPVYRLVFEFWLKIFGVAFGLGVVSGRLTIGAHRCRAGSATRAISCMSPAPTPAFCCAGSTVIGPTPAIGERSSRKLLPRIWPLCSATIP